MTICGYDVERVGPAGRDQTPTGEAAFVLVNLERCVPIRQDCGMVLSIDLGNGFRAAADFTPGRIKGLSGFGDAEDGYVAQHMPPWCWLGCRDKARQKPS